MANLNKTECGCTGIYNATTSSCDIPDAGVDPCPSWFSSMAGWNWNEIAETSLTWGYALGIFNQPNNLDAETLAYQQEIQRQKDQMTYLIIAFLIVVVILVIYVARANKKK